MSVCQDFEYTAALVESHQELKEAWTNRTPIGLAKLAVLTARTKEELESALVDLPEKSQINLRYIRRDLYR